MTYFLQIFIERSTLSVCDRLGDFELSHGHLIGKQMQKYCF
jgi:hypothetical protein